MKKNLSLMIVFVLMVSLFTACTPKQATPGVAPEATTKTPAVTEADVITTASIVDNADALIKAMSAEGTWIAATLNDITLTDALVVEGEFLNKEKVARKLAPYTQDADHNITASFTITAPSIMVKSENFKFQGGVFVGDIYVEAKGFQVSKATVDGNIYYASEEIMATAVIAEDGVVTGVIEVK